MPLIDCDGKEMRAQIEEMAARRYDVMVAIAMGGFVPAGVLSRALETPVAGAITTRGYSGHERLARVQIDAMTPVGALARDENGRGRSVLLVDDICDSGGTLTTVARAFGEAGATIVDACVVIARPGYKLSGVRRLYSLSVTPDLGWVTFPWETDERFGLLGLCEVVR
jgi:adenine/guanine phosphoribosyltransferase-like PRPP-binding protein